MNKKINQINHGSKNKICDIALENFLTALSRQLTNYCGNIFPERKADVGQQC